MTFRTELAEFGEFYERTYQVAYRTALAIVRDPALAADVAQDAYASAFTNQGAFRGEVPAHVWLHRIVVNHAISSLRRRRQVIHELQVVEIDHNAPDPARTASDRIALFGALEQLTPQQRAAVVLRYYVDYDYATIAIVLGTTATNVGTLLSRALDRLRRELEPEAASAAEAAR